MRSTIALAALLAFLQAALADWNIDNNTFTPCKGQVNSNETYSVSDDTYNRLLLNRGYLDFLNTLAAQNDSDIFKFNFNPAVAKSGFASRGAGGVAILANKETFPALITTSVSMAYGFLEPCGINTPHYHPFATQLVTVIEGGPLRVGAVWDNAATTQQMETDVYTYEMVNLPQGSIHFEFNDSCDRLITVNAFNTNDPGILNVAPNLFKLDPGAINGTFFYPKSFDGYSAGDFLNHIPPSYTLGAEACLKRCGINKDIVGSPPS